MIVVITSAAILLAAPWPIWALVGSLLGFLLWNWSPAKVIMGTLAAQRGPIDRVALHRHDHKFSDQPNDHHDAGRGLWWSHSEWMLHEIPSLERKERFSGDLLKDLFYGWLDRWFLVLQIPIGLALYWYGYVAQGQGGRMDLVLWAIPLRLVAISTFCGKF